MKRDPYRPRPSVAVMSNEELRNLQLNTGSAKRIESDGQKNNSRLSINMSNAYISPLRKISENSLKVSGTPSTRKIDLSQNQMILPSSFLSIKINETKMDNKKTLHRRDSLKMVPASHSHSFSGQALSRGGALEIDKLSINKPLSTLSTKFIVCLKPPK